MTAFFGTFTNKIDSKGRLSVPAPFRAILQAEGRLSAHIHPSLSEPCLEGAGLDRFQKLLAGVEDGFVGNPADDAAELIMEDLRELPFDGEGRIVLPDEFIAAAALKDQASFVGRGWKFQIWEPAALSARRQEKLRRVTSALKGGAP
jgi:MraZ protein